MAREDLLVLGKARTRETMTPKEKAKELYHKFQVYEVNGQKHTQYGPQVKVFTLIAVDEINKAIDFDWMEIQNLESQHRFWDNVKQEIEKL